MKVILNIGSIFNPRNFLRGAICVCVAVVNLSENLLLVFQMDFVNYSVEQMQELRQKNTSLENKLNVLENHLHDAKYGMEKQTLECQKELKLVQNAVST